MTAGDDGELYLSSDSDPARKVRIATCSGETSSAHDFYHYPSQQSAPVQLVAGTRYYIEALHKQDKGQGYLAVAWQLPNGTRQEPVPGSALVPFGATAALSTASALIADASAPDAAKLTEVHIYPNPVTGRPLRATVQFSSAKNGIATLTLLNLQGQLVRKLFTGTLEAGMPQSVVLEGADLSDGLYVVRLVTPTEVVNHKVVFTRE